RSKSSFRHVPIEAREAASLPMIECCSMAGSSFFGPAQLGAICPKHMALGRLSRTASGSGAMRKSSRNSGPNACATRNRSTESSGNGKAGTALTCGRRWGGKENGPHPTDRAKPGMKAHGLVDGRGVPLRVVVTAANLNDHIALPELLKRPGRRAPAPDLRRAAAHLFRRGFRY